MTPCEYLMPNVVLKREEKGLASSPELLKPYWVEILGALVKGRFLVSKAGRGTEIPHFNELPDDVDVGLPTTP